MKKLTSLILALVLLTASTSTIFAAPAVSGVILNGQELNLDVYPVAERGRTLVPARAIFEALGFDVSWDGHKKITAIRGNERMVLTLGDTWGNFYNRIRFSSGVSAKTINNRTMVPVRIISEIIGLDVKWNNHSRKVIIDSNNVKPPISLSQAYNTLYNRLVDNPNHDLMYIPLDSYATDDEIASEANYMFAGIGDYGYGIEIAGDINYLLNKYNGKMSSYGPNGPEGPIYSIDEIEDMIVDDMVNGR